MSSARDPEVKKQYMDAVAKHLATVGANNWTAILDAFPDIQISTKWRWIREAKEAKVPKPQLINSHAKLAQRVKRLPKDLRAQESAENGTEKIAKQLPAAPSPHYIAKNGEAGLATIDFVSEIHILYADAKMLRAFSVTDITDPETGEVLGEKIKNPVTFDKSIARRADLLDTAIKAVQEVWDLRTMQNFYETIIQEIGKESPEAKRRIMDRLAVLNGKTGMTMSMRL